MNAGTTDRNFVRSDERMLPISRVAKPPGRSFGRIVAETERTSGRTATETERIFGKNVGTIERTSRKNVTTTGVTTKKIDVTTEARRNATKGTSAITRAEVMMRTEAKVRDKARDKVRDKVRDTGLSSDTSKARDTGLDLAMNSQAPTPKAWVEGIRKLKSKESQRQERD